MIRRLLIVSFISALFFSGATAGSAMETASRSAGQVVDLELMLAIDASLSVDRKEFELQKAGLAAAFRDRALHSAIRDAGPNGIVVSVVQWGDVRSQVVSVDWTLIRSGDEALAFADTVEQAPRDVYGPTTSLSGMLEFAGPRFSDNGYEGLRQVIDVSGDGKQNQGFNLRQLRDGLVDSGITINGLPILGGEDDVDRFYLDSVIGGTGAFLVTADGFGDFARAMRMKLLREIGGMPMVEAPGDEDNILLGWLREGIEHPSMR